jgi:hypothetical protein
MKQRKADSALLQRFLASSSARNEVGGGGVSLALRLRRIAQDDKADVESTGARSQPPSHKCYGRRSLMLQSFSDGARP